MSTNSLTVFNSKGFTATCTLWITLYHSIPNNSCCVCIRNLSIAAWTTVTAFSPIYQPPRWLDWNQFFSYLVVVERLFLLPCVTRYTGLATRNESITNCASWHTNVSMVWHLATCHVPVCLSKQLRDVLSCVHLTIINCSSHGHEQSLLDLALSTHQDPHHGTLYQLHFVIQLWHLDVLGRCWKHFYSGQTNGCCWLYVAARACDILVNGHLKCLLLLLLCIRRVCAVEGERKLHSPRTVQTTSLPLRFQHVTQALYVYSCYLTHRSTPASTIIIESTKHWMC